MKVCQKCNKTLEDSARFCTGCGARTDECNSSNIQPQSTNEQCQTTPQTNNFQPQQTTYSQPFIPAEPADNRKAYSIISYIGILWLFGMLAVPEKFDRRVRFNVGQGIMASITSAICSIAAVILSTIFNIAFTEEQTVFGYGTGYYETSATADILSTLVWMAAFGISVFYTVWGIVKVCQNRDGYLPIIGRFAFYK